jgi:SAM-dependent MidA family methyltransferase
VHPARTWQAAWQRSQTGAGGFYRHHRPGDHFTTSVLQAPDALAAALAQLARDRDLTTVIDVGAGDGLLATALARALPQARVIGVDLRSPDFPLPPRVSWSSRPPRRSQAALLVAHELLDDIPVCLAELDPQHELRHVLVTDTGQEQLGPRLGHREREWVRRWWPLTQPGDRCEVGLSRDQAWRRLVGSVHSGVTIAIDYGHTRQHRPWWGTLRAYRHGRQVRCLPENGHNITADVAVDSVAAVVPGGEVMTQAEALARLLPADAIPTTLTSAQTGGGLWWVRHDT